MNVPIRKRKGFTLIELLIVITIIGILAVALVPRISQGPARARDVQRKADLSNIASSLELYYADIGSYPVAATVECLAPGTGTGDLLEDYLGGTFPTPPSGASAGTCSGANYIYMSADGSGYTIATETEILSTTTGYYCSITTWEPLSATACVSTDTAPFYYLLDR